MGTSRIQDGKVLSYAHTASTTKDVPLALNGLLMMPLETKAANATNDYSIEGVHNVPGTASTTYVMGENVYWDVSAAKVAKADGFSPATGDFLCGKVAKPTVLGGGGGNVPILINQPAPAITA